MIFSPQIKSILALVYLWRGVALVQGQNNATEALDCAAATEELRLDPNVNAALDAAYNETTEFQPVDKCSSSNCAGTLDYAKADQTYRQVCNDAGGQIVDASFVMVCKIHGVTLSYNWQAVPECVAQSCNTTVSEELLTKMTNEHASRLNQMEGVKDCGATLTGSAAAAATNNWIVVVGGSILASFLL